MDNYDEKLEALSKKINTRLHQIHDQVKIVVNVTEDVEFHAYHIRFLYGLIILLYILLAFK